MFPAPKSRHILDANPLNDGISPQSHPEHYYWFCKEHAAAYNRNWDYFCGMSGTEIEQFQTDALTGHRPTWRIGEDAVSGASPFIHEDVLREAFRELQNGEASHYRSRVYAQYIPENERRAMAVLDLQPPLDQKQLKARYKLLVKSCHPDLHAGDRGKEEIFKRINEAYRILAGSHYIAE